MYMPLNTLSFYETLTINIKIIFRYFIESDSV